jgi:hypothetical protein
MAVLALTRTAALRYDIRPNICEEPPVCLTKVKGRSEECFKVPAQLNFRGPDMKRFRHASGAKLLGGIGVTLALAGYGALAYAEAPSRSGKKNACDDTGGSI